MNKTKIYNLFVTILSIFVILPLFLIFFNLNPYSIDNHLLLQKNKKENKLKHLLNQKKKQKNELLFTKYSTFNDSLYSPLSYKLI